MFRIPWVVWVGTSILLLTFFAVTSLIFSKGGTFTTMNDLITPERWFGNSMTIDDNKKFESEGERISRKCLENIYGLPFKNVRLSEIKNPNTDKKLEIDCYNRELQIGLEYHGQCHYKFIPFFHKTVDAFQDSVMRDKWKQQVCEKLGIVLIIVPYTCRHEKICDYILKELKRYGKIDHILGWDDSHK